MISIKNKFLFIHVPKTGGNSVQNVLHHYSDDKITYKGAEIEEPDSVNLERFGVAYKDTSLSKHSTLDEYRQVFGHELDRLYKFSIIRNPWDRCISYYFSPHRGSVEWDKNDFIQLVINEIFPMRYFLSLKADDDFSLNIDRLIQFESLSKHFNEVAERLKIKQITLPHKNKSNKKHYSHYYDKELIDLIHDKFHEDVALGCYEYRIAKNS